LNTDELASFIDHAALGPTTRYETVAGACDDAKRFGFRGVVVPSAAVAHAQRLLRESDVKIIATVGFPHGTAAPEVKAFEAARAVELGADEVDYVISVGAALDGDFRFIREEGSAIVRACGGKIVKAIVEVGFLDETQLFQVASGLADSGVAYIKTCTGFAPGAATPEIVKFLVQAVAGRCLIKASGGIKEPWQAVELLKAGAAVLGTSRGPHLCSP